MAFNDNSRLTLDLKSQDRLREWFSKRASGDVVKLTAVQLGDSDIDYELSQQAIDIRVLNAPYQVEGIKHKLIYEGAVTNITGAIECYIRHVNELGQVSSYYNYPTTLTLSLGVYPPLRANQVPTTSLAFNTGSSDREGFICFFQTLPDGFLDENNVKKRLKEEYTFTVTNLPPSWEVIIDQINGSLFIAKPSGYTFASGAGTILIQGLTSSLSTTITFNN